MQERFWILVSRQFAGEITDGEQQELEKLLDEHPEWEKQHGSLRLLWHTEDKEGNEDAEKAYRQVRARILLEARPQAPVRQMTWRYAAALLLAGLFAGLWWYADSGRHDAGRTAWQQTATPKGNRTRLVLPDGSTVWLNADSKLRYPKTFGTARREVFLEGEAFFDVVKNRQKPFLVKTQRATIRVLGTSFNVNAYPERETMETALVTGLVEIARENAPAIEEPFVLVPGEQAIYSRRTNAFTRHRADSRLSASWKDGRLRFDNEPFASVATKLERWYNVTIHLQTKDLQQERFTATVENKSLEEVLKLIGLATPIRYRIKGREVFVDRDVR